jgi:HK97 gp10 family phage protein
MTFDLAGFADFLLRTASRNLEAVEEEVVAAAAEMIAQEARDMIGHPNPGWPPLSPSTIARKGRDTPLLDTGAMRASISSDGPYKEGDAIVAYAGATDRKAQWHEFGTSRIPPRPFIGMATEAKRQAIQEMMRKAVHAALAQERGLTELGDIMKKALGAVKDLGQELLGDDGERR